MKVAIDVSWVNSPHLREQMEDAGTDNILCLRWHPPSWLLPGTRNWNPKWCEGEIAPHGLSPLGSAALQYAERGYPGSPGWPVFPLKPGGKEPLTRHGFKDASHSTAQIVKWWRKWPDANIGSCPGLAGLFVVDVDRRSGGEEEARRLGLFDVASLTVETADGWHLYFRKPKDFKVGNLTLGPGLDVRADAGYVILPPSVHPNGKVYRWYED